MMNRRYILREELFWWETSPVSLFFWFFLRINLLIWINVKLLNKKRHLNIFYWHTYININIHLINHHFFALWKYVTTCSAGLWETFACVVNRLLFLKRRFGSHLCMSAVSYWRASKRRAPLSSPVEQIRACFMLWGRNWVIKLWDVPVLSGPPCEVLV